ncbi:MAG: hypothetical protein CV087_05745, partial [Candidatus Brocadia sp. WS118]
YNAALQPLSETISGLYSATITRNYAISGVIGRPTGLTTGALYTQTYGYDTKGRYNFTGWTVNALSGSATYTYVSNSDLIGTLTTGSGQSTTYSYETNRNLRTQINNQFSSTLISQYDYAYDAIGRRTSVKNSGSAFAAAAFNRFVYNDRSELNESARYLGTDINILTSPVTSELRNYTYDPIGNRTAITVGTNGGTYTPNNLNQYSGETVPGGGANVFTYDDDGNLTAISGVKNVLYTFNAENQLITTQPTTPVLNNKKVDFVYDYQGRRVQKIVSNWAGVAWVTESTKRFVYDGWNVIEEQTVAGTSKYYVWGLDLSQSLQGAGGVGGLLTMFDGVGSYAYLYDGNGNVGQMINNVGGAISAHYEYDPYGNSILATGSQAAGNPYRFSTKYLDTEYNLYYYGYRYYDPLTGRWLSRDPIGEKGGINLQSFVVNNSINKIDLLGNTSFTDIDSGRLFYTWHMGWLDVLHMERNRSLDEAWKKINRVSNGTSVLILLTQDQTPVSIPLTNIRVGKVTDGYFCINVDKSRRQGQLLYAWMQVSEAFESLQGSGIQDSQLVNTIFGGLTGEVDKRASGFSTEDLVSNLVSFYSTVDNTNYQALVNKYAGRFNARFTVDDEKIISRAIWRNALKPSKGTATWTPQYFDHEEFLLVPFPNGGDRYYNFDEKWDHETAQQIIPRYRKIFGEPTFPAYFQKYKPTSKGVSTYLENNGKPIGN